MFCMLLRKHLSGARLIEVNQLPMERCASFVFDCIDELGDRVNKTLVAELMGRTCNLYLLAPDGRILDCLRRIGLDETAKRPALPGMYYQNPEPVEKMDPQGLVTEDYVNLLSDPGADLLSQRLMDALLAQLSERQRMVLRLHFGMEDGTCYSLEQISIRFGVSKERVRQIERQAMDKLQKLGADLGLEEFL